MKAYVVVKDKYGIFLEDERGTVIAQYFDEDEALLSKNMREAREKNQREFDKFMDDMHAYLKKEGVI